MPALSHPELLKRLRRLSAALNDNVRLINHGGCGIVAGAVGEHLEALGVPVEIVTPDGDYGNFSSPAAARAQLDAWGFYAEECNPVQWDEAGLWRSHLAIRFESEGRLYTWDSAGLVRGGRRFGVLAQNGRKRLYWHTANYEFGHGLTIKECQRMSSCATGWNSRFDRRQVPTITALVEQHLAGAWV